MFICILYYRIVLYICVLLYLYLSYAPILTLTQTITPTHIHSYMHIGMDLVTNPINLSRIILSTTRIMSPIADHKSVQFISETGYLASFTPTTSLPPLSMHQLDTDKGHTDQPHAVGKNTHTASATTSGNNSTNNKTDNEYKKGLVKTVGFKQQSIHQQQLQLQSHWSHRHTTGTDGEEEEAGMSVEEWRNFTALGTLEYVYMLHMFVHVYLVETILTFCVYRVAYVVLYIFAVYIYCSWLVYI